MAAATADSLATLLDQMRASLTQGEIPAQIFCDQSVFDAEMKRIFGRSWIFVAFESEIPKSGDYVLRRIGTDQVIVTRDAKGAISVLSNLCRHRGSLVCQADRGNTTHFRCPYHGWVYKNNGDWLSAPAMAEAYRHINRKDWGLFKAPHVESYLGFIFASLDEHAPSLKDYLGDAAWMLQLLMDLHPDGARVMGPPDRYRVRADWKSGAENFSGDIYHIAVAHSSISDVGYIPGVDTLYRTSTHYAMGNGHNFLGQAYGEMLGEMGDFWGHTPEDRALFEVDHLDPVQRDVIRNNPPIVGTLFPNLSFIRFAASPSPGEPPAVATSWRVWQPISPGVMEVWSWSLAWNFQSEKSQQASYATCQ